ncbi:MAG TPA: transposase [Ktedonobacteraceae bacterium]|nr:transposase [Ktedonobacteraceae bacterium]
MKKVQKPYTAEFKRESVRLACRSSAPIAHIARELGISNTRVHQLRKQLAGRDSALSQRQKYCYTAFACTATPVNFSEKQQHTILLCNPD